MNQITQIAIELPISRGTTTLTIIKAESHDNVDTQKPYHYMAQDLNVVFDQDKQGAGQLNLGFALRNSDVNGVSRKLSWQKLTKNHLLRMMPNSLSLNLQ
jgi:hypothetical protein